MIDQTQRALNLIGLSLKAGKLIMGEGLVLAALRQHKLQLVIVAADASDATRHMLTSKSASYQTPIIQAFSKEAIDQALGRPRTILGVTDVGFAKRLIALLNTQGA